MSNSPNHAQGMMRVLTQPAAERFLQRLAAERGYIVSSNDCSVAEIEQARACGRFFVDNNNHGYVLRPKEVPLP